jgi:hypothetical protein
VKSGNIAVGTPLEGTKPKEGASRRPCLTADAATDFRGRQRPGGEPGIVYTNVAVPL